MEVTGRHHEGGTNYPGAYPEDHQQLLPACFRSGIISHCQRIRIGSKRPTPVPGHLGTSVVSANVCFIKIIAVHALRS
jgi:hypothetical protein